MAAIQPRQPSSAPTLQRRLAVGVTELVFSSSLLLLYFYLRGMRPDDIPSSVRRTLHVIQVQDRFGLFWEPELQSFAVQHDWLMTGANFIYAWGLFPLIGAISVWLAFSDVKRFRFIRNVMLVSGMVGLLCYWLVPAAPPRLMEAHGYDFGFIDTIHDVNSNAHYFQPGPLVNDYAALPSFHFGWVALMGAALWVNTHHRGLRSVAIGFPVLMWFSIIFTANHFILDMVFGAAVVSLSWMFVSWVEANDIMGRTLRWITQTRERGLADPQVS